jgi:transposase InsO family protein
LVAVQDIYSRRIVGWAIDSHMRAELALDALTMALARRRPAPGLIWDSDQGSQFVSLAFGEQAGAAGIAQSLGSRGDCYDNAVAESFFAEGARPPPLLAREGRAAHGGLRVHRGLLQPPPPAPQPRLSLARAFETITHHHLEDLQPEKTYNPPNRPLSTKAGELHNARN